jgi:hypothetical protein
VLLLSLTLLSLEVLLSPGVTVELYPFGFPVSVAGSPEAYLPLTVIGAEQ